MIIETLLPISHLLEISSAQIENDGKRRDDKFVVPIAKPLENFIVPPLGKNLLVIAEKI